MVFSEALTIFMYDFGSPLSDAGSFVTEPLLWPNLRCRDMCSELRQKRQVARIPRIMSPSEAGNSIPQQLTSSRMMPALAKANVGPNETNQVWVPLWITVEHGD